MKKLIVLIIMMMIKLTVFCQTGIQSTTKEIPTDVVKLMIKDIIRFDSLKAINQLNNEYIYTLQKGIDTRDSIINGLNHSYDNLNKKLEYTQSENIMIKHYSETLEIAIKKEKVGNTFKDILSLSLIGTLLSILILK